MVVGQTCGGVVITQPIYNRWVSLGSPENWCYPCHFRGDINNDGYIDSTDLMGDEGPPAIFGWVYAWDTYDARSDINDDGYIDASDLMGSDSVDGWIYGWNNGCP
jgi:hypothetical protein